MLSSINFHFFSFEKLLFSFIIIVLRLYSLQNKETRDLTETQRVVGSVSFFYTLPSVHREFRKIPRKESRNFLYAEGNSCFRV